MKKRLTLTLVFAILALGLCALAGSAGAAGNFTWSVKDGVMTIKGTGTIGPYDYASSRADEITTSPWDSRSDVTSLVIGEGITYIGNLSFSYLNNLKEVTLPSTLTGYTRGSNIYNAFSSSRITRINWNGTQDQWIRVQGRNYSTILDTGDLMYNKPELYIGGAPVTEVRLTKASPDLRYAAFRGCQDIVKLTVEAGYAGKIYDAQFPNLTTVEFLGEAPGIDDYAFSSMTATVKYIPYASWDGKTLPYGGTLTWLPQGVTAQGQCGSDVSWKLLSDGTLVITGTGAMNNYDSTSIPWYSYKSDIKSIQIGQGVTYIGKYAFADLTALITADMADTVTEMGDYAFANTGKATIHLSKSLTTLPQCCFQWCNFEEIELPPKLETVERYAFELCLQLKHLELPDTVTDIGQSAFRRCDNLETLTLPDNVTGIGNEDIFYGLPETVTIRCRFGSETAKRLPLSYRAALDALNYQYTSLLYVDPEWPAYSFKRLVPVVTDATLETYELPAGVTELKAGLFANCANMRWAVLPSSVEAIDAAAFPEGVEEIYAPAGSFAAGWANENNLLTYDPALPDDIIPAMAEAHIGLDETLDLSGLFRVEAAYRRTDNAVQFAAEGPGALEGAMLTPTGLGEITVSASAAGVAQTRSLKVRVSERITGLTLPARVRAAVGTTIPLEAEWSPAEADPELVWSLADDVATIDGDTLTVTAAETVNTTLTATAWNGVSASATLQIYVPEVRTVTFRETEGRYAVGDTAQLYAEVRDQIRAYTNQLVTFESSDPEIALVDGTGQVTFLAPGRATVTARSENGVSASVDLRASVPTEDFAVGAPPVLFAGETYAMAVTEALPAEAAEGIAWSSGDAAVATVSPDGVVTAVGAGETEILAESWDGVRRSAAVVVHDAITGVSIDAPEEPYYILDIIPLAARVRCETELVNAFVTFSSSDPAIASVDENGRVTLRSYGDAVITATTVNGLTAELPLHVRVEAESFGLSSESLQLYVGQTGTIEVINPVPDDANLDLTFASDDAAVCTVDPDGTVTAVCAGQARISVKTWNGVIRTAEVSVRVPEPARLTLALAGVPKMLDPVQCDATVETDDGYVIADAALAWRSSDPAVAIVDDAGRITPVGSGRATIYAVTENGIEADVTVDLPELTKIALPSALSAVEAESFEGSSAQSVVIPRDCEAIASRAFADCKQLTAVYFEGTRVRIADDAFEGSTDVHFVCAEDSDARTYAEAHGIPCFIVPLG